MGLQMRFWNLSQPWLRLAWTDQSHSCYIQSMNWNEDSDPKLDLLPQLDMLLNSMVI